MQHLKAASGQVTGINMVMSVHTEHQQDHTRSSLGVGIVSTEVDFRILQHLNAISIGVSFTLVDIPTPKQVYRIDINFLFWTVNIVINAKIQK